jgi:phage terminase large subunit-like protein
VANFQPFCLFGRVKVATGTRGFSLAYIEVARKNAKSILAAIIGCYIFACDGEFGAEVYSGATKEDQAMEVFRPALLMLYRSVELRQFLGVKIASRGTQAWGWRLAQLRDR